MWHSLPNCGYCQEMGTQFWNRSMLVTWVRGTCVRHLSLYAEWRRKVPLGKLWSLVAEVKRAIWYPNTCKRNNMQTKPLWGNIIKSMYYFLEAQIISRWKRCFKHKLLVLLHLAWIKETIIAVHFLAQGGAKFDTGKNTQVLYDIEYLLRLKYVYKRRRRKFYK